MVKLPPRGIRNNNPGNIRITKDKWRGLAEQQTDPAFLQFTRPEYGIRAMAIILLRYQRVYGRNTVAGIIDKWAPAKGDSNGAAPGGEYTQDSGAYAKAVAAAMGVGVNEGISIASTSRMFALLSAMIKHENGQQPFGRDIIMQAINMAGIR